MIWTMLILFPQTFNSSHQEALLYVIEDNEAVIKMIIKGRSPIKDMFPEPTEFALDWLFERINLDPEIQIKYIFAKGNFTRDEWTHLLCLFNITHYSSINCSEVMSKERKKDSGDERVTAKSKPMMNLVSRCSERNPDVLASTASESPGKTRYESQSDEIYGVTPINWEDSSWKHLSLVGDEQVINLQSTKVYVFSDSVLCLGKVTQNPTSNMAWEDRLTWFNSSPQYTALDRIDGEPMEFEWNIFQGFTTLQLSHKVQELLLRSSVTPE